MKNWMDKLVEEAASQTPPKNAFTVSDFISRPDVNMTKARATAFLSKKAADGILQRKIYPGVSGNPFFYWPAEEAKK